MFAGLKGQGLASLPQQVEVVKHLWDGKLKTRYFGTLIGASLTERLILAKLDFDHCLFGEYWLRAGDTFVEWYSSECAYNILELHCGQTGKVKFWYCNLSWPAKFTRNAIIWTDLALDLVVSAEKKFFLLDQDEFARLNLPWPEYRQVWQTLVFLLNQFSA
ncbi:MAG: DUF402 domain-containing protein [Anaerolineaceae bacterium]|nr:DUF402 domain-containing protein [Anaerolineaceae bacterium]